MRTGALGAEEQLRRLVSATAKPEPEPRGTLTKHQDRGGGADGSDAVGGQALPASMVVLTDGP